MKKDLSLEFENWINSHSSCPQTDEQWTLFKNNLHQYWKKLELENYALRHEAMIDQLTQSLKFHYFESEFKRRLLSLQRHSLVIIDLDNFKEFNKRFGHLAGNQVLRQVGQFLKSQLPISGLLCRLGGDEFIMSFPVNKSSEVKAFCHVLQEQLSKSSFIIGSQTQLVTLSIGATITGDLECFEDIIERADYSLRQVKSNFKGQFKFSYSPTDSIKSHQLN